MKKPIIPIIAIAVIIIGIVAFSFIDFETTVDIPKSSDTDEAGDNVSSDGTLVTIVEVTDKAGEVVATEKVTFSQDEVKFGQDFFAKPSDETTLPNGIAPDRLQALTSQANNIATTNNGKKPDSNTDKTTTSNKPSTQTTTSSGTKPTKPSVPEQELTELDIIKSQRYYFSGRIVDSNGNVSVYKIARDGRKYSAVAMVDGQEMGIISNDTEILVVSVTEKTYMSIPLSLVQENSSDDEVLQSFLSGEGLNSQRNEVRRYNADEDGVTYEVIEYENGSKDYVYNNLLIKTVGADNSVFYYDVVTIDFPASVFMAPVGYEKKDLSEVGASEFAEDLGVNIETTVPHAHNHDDE
jgi:hypothetical protein